MSDVLIIVVLVVLGLLAFFVGFWAVWKNFHHLLSLRDEVELSNLGYGFRRIQMAFGAGLVAALLMDTLAFVAMGVISAKLVPSELSSAPSTNQGATKPAEDATASSPILEAPRTSENSGVTSANTQSPEPASPSDTRQFSGSAPSVLTGTGLSREDVERMEREKQYSGNDPIIRERLGLPPKP